MICSKFIGHFSRFVCPLFVRATIDKIHIKILIILPTPGINSCTWNQNNFAIYIKKLVASSSLSYANVFAFHFQLNCISISNLINSFLVCVPQLSGSCRSSSCVGSLWRISRLFQVNRRLFPIQKSQTAFWVPEWWIKCWPVKAQRVLHTRTSPFIVKNADNAVSITDTGHSDSDQNRTCSHNLKISTQYPTE